MQSTNSQVTSTNRKSNVSLSKAITVARNGRITKSQIEDLKLKIFPGKLPVNRGGSFSHAADRPNRIGCIFHLRRCREPLGRRPRKQTFPFDAACHSGRRDQCTGCCVPRNIHGLFHNKGNRVLCKLSKPYTNYTNNLNEKKQSPLRATARVCWCVGVGDAKASSRYWR